MEPIPCLWLQLTGRCRIFVRSKDQIVFKQLAIYLFRQKELQIPRIGRFWVVQQPARLDVADKLILPPVFEVRFGQGPDPVPEYQLAYLAEWSDQPVAAVHNELERVGAELGSSYSISDTQVDNDAADPGYSSKALHIEGLQAIPARKVIREHAQHTVLVGEREMQSGAVREMLNATGSKRSYAIIAGWILLFLAVAAIVLLLFNNKFALSGTGNKAVITPEQPAPSYK